MKTKLDYSKIENVEVEEYEEWRDVKNYKGRYKVSNLGRVKSIERKVPNGNNSFRTINSRILKPYLKDYLYVYLTKNCVKESYTVHKLVADAFLVYNDNDRSKLDIDHINNIKTDNCVDNLQLISRRENINKDKVRKNLLGAQRNNGRGKPWRSSISINGKTKYLGRFDTEIEAHNAYLKQIYKLKKNK